MKNDLAERLITFNEIKHGDTFLIILYINNMYFKPAVTVLKNLVILFSKTYLNNIFIFTFFGGSNSNNVYLFHAFGVSL